jgi:uncharacterized spore protein YtfJ
MPINIAMDTTVRVPVRSGKTPTPGGSKSGAQIVPKTCVVISDNNSKVVGRRDRTMPTVMIIVNEVAKIIRPITDF